MNGMKTTLISSAIGLGLLGIALSFAPQEILQLIGVTPTPVLSLMAQLMGALYVGYALMNWMSRGLLVGGIYGRPMAIGNFTHFLVGALALLKGLTKLSDVRAFPVLITIFYVAFAVAFGLLLFKTPKKVKAMNQE